MNWMDAALLWLLTAILLLKIRDTNVMLRRYVVESVLGAPPARNLANKIRMQSANRGLALACAAIMLMLESPVMAALFSSLGSDAFLKESLRSLLVSVCIAMDMILRGNARRSAESIESLHRQEIEQWGDYVTKQLSGHTEE